MFLKRLLWLSVSLIILTSHALAQSPSPSPQADDPRKAQLELEQKAVGLLEDVLKDAESFKHLENRVRIKTAVADLMWGQDVVRARTLFREAMAGLLDLTKNASAEEGSAERTGMVEGARQLRAQLLQTLARRDGRLARELLRASSSGAPKPGADRDPAQEMEQQEDLNLAIQAASYDPKLAAEIGHENLTGPGSYRLPELLSALMEKDPEGAAKLASDLLSKLRTEKLDSSPEASGVAVSLLRLATQEPEAGKPRVPLLDQTSLRELAELVAVEALGSTPHSAELLASLHDMMPVMEKYAPARAASMRRKMPKAEKAEGGGEEGVEVSKGEDYSKFENLMTNGSVEEIQAEAAKQSEPMRTSLYSAAATKLIEKGDTAGARQLINDKIQDPEMRKQLLEALENMSTTSAAEAGSLEQVRKMLATLRTKEERAILLSQVALGAAAKGQRKLALELLEEAGGMVAQRAKNIQQLAAQFMIARAYARVDPSRSLAMLEPMVDQLNELLAAAAVLGGFFAEELVRDDEIMLGPVMMFLSFTGGGEFSQYVVDLSTLARADYGRTRALVDRFQRDEIRAAARLLLAQSILTPQPQPEAPKVFMTPYGIGAP